MFISFNWWTRLDSDIWGALCVIHPAPGADCDGRCTGINLEYNLQIIAFLKKMQLLCPSLTYGMHSLLILSVLHVFLFFSKHRGLLVLEGRVFIKNKLPSFIQKP
jgi:hypothetical protein